MEYLECFWKNPFYYWIPIFQNWRKRHPNTLKIGGIVLTPGAENFPHPPVKKIYFSPKNNSRFDRIFQKPPRLFFSSRFASMLNDRVMD